MTISEILSTYRPITLDEMSGIKLMNRTDTKFVTTTAFLLRLLEMAKQDYRVQQIGDARIASYYTLYFDTPRSDMYLVHHNGKKWRQKLRIRSYVDSKLNFLEVKTKNNHGRTKKKRMTLADFDPTAPQYGIRFAQPSEAPTEQNEFVAQHLKQPLEILSEKVENRFDRITLVNNAKTERLTIDTHLRFHNVSTGRDYALDDIVIIELKRDGLVFSPILEMLRTLRIKPMGFSKYCIGTALTDPAIKKNRFRLRLHNIQRLLERNAAENETHQETN